MRSIVDLNWLNLVAYVLIEQLFLASFRRLDYRIVGYIPMVVALTQLGLRRDPFSFLQAQEMGLLLPVCECPKGSRNNQFVEKGRADANGVGRNRCCL
jgi:hypothetical protein